MDLTSHIKIRFSLSMILLVFGTWVTLSQAARTFSAASSPSYDEQYEQWMVQHGRVYKNPYEKEMRFRIFKDNVARIDEFNREANRGYELGINQFADLTNEEFKARNRYKAHLCPVQTGFKYENVTAVPTSVDWRKNGAVTPIKNQGQCGSCWTFSAVAAIEGINQLTTGKLLSLSEQEIVDCDRTSQDQGCSGGWMDDAFTFVVQNHGITTEANYPYQAADGTCNKQRAANHAAIITGHEDVPSNDEAALEKAAANQPISVAIDDGGFDFQFYKSGIFNGSCTTQLDHGVAVVGYGVSDGTNYWIVKNSWGPQWGEEGYIRMQKDVAAKEGLCGIAMKASYPTA